MERSCSGGTTLTILPLPWQPSAACSAWFSCGTREAARDCLILRGGVLSSLKRAEQEAYAPAIGQQRNLLSEMTELLRQARLYPRRRPCRLKGDRTALRPGRPGSSPSPRLL